MNRAGAIAVIDDVGREVHLAARARRIVSLVPSLTETLFALQRGDCVIGVTRYCSEPAAMSARVLRVGGTKNPDVDRVRALAPDLVLVNAEENRHEDFEALIAAGLTVFVSYPTRARQVLALLERLGQLAGAVAAATDLAEQLQAALAAVPQIADRQRLRVFCPIWKNPWMSFNGDTYGDDMLWNAGALNVCRARPERYCQVTLDEIRRSAPDFVLLPDEPYVFRPHHRDALAPLCGTPAWPDRIYCIDGKALSWYGPRTAAALGSLRAIVAGVSAAAARPRRWPSP